ncbi:MAG: hypothetical protein EA376_09835 [Phycisphaeraceae bacterium]|nr:MAG: hypothetical protein EA376_09835 [Phycisphaeraceae bacterium]
MAETRIVTVTLNPALDHVIVAENFKIGKRVAGWIADDRYPAGFPTGKGIAISRVLGFKGIRSIATGFVGRNELDMFEGFLEKKASGRVVSQFLVVQKRTRDNITIVDPVNETETHIRDVGFEVQQDDVKRISSKVAMLSRPDTIVCFAGSLPRGLEPEQFGRLVARCVGQGARVVVDTNSEGLRGLKTRRLWMIKLNVDEVGMLADLPVDSRERLIEAARSLTAARGGSYDVVLVTRGADGAMLFTEDVALIGQVSVHPGRIVSTAGSGESLVAGVLSVLNKGGDWVSALREGLALATANAIGREAGLVDEGDAEEFRVMAMVDRIED